MPGVTVASFNIHAGTDGWGRPYDLVGACRQLDSDVIVLQEAFAPLEGASQAEEVASELGFDCVDFPLTRAWQRRVPLWQGKGWEPRRQPHRDKALYVGEKLPHTSTGRAAFEEGTWGLAVLSKPEVVGSQAIELGKLKRDFTRRAALVLELDLPGSGDGRGFTIIGTHAAHLTAGSPFQFRRLRDAITVMEAGLRSPVT